MRRRPRPAFRRSQAWRAVSGGRAGAAAVVVFPSFWARDRGVWGMVGGTEMEKRLNGEATRLSERGGGRVRVVSCVALHQNDTLFTYARASAPLSRPGSRGAQLRNTHAHFKFKFNRWRKGRAAGVERVGESGAAALRPDTHSLYRTRAPHPSLKEWVGEWV